MVFEGATYSLGSLISTFPFILRPVLGHSDDQDGPVYHMMDIAHVDDHEYEHKSLDNITPEARWEGYAQFGMTGYGIM
jgi:hypothetical protein